MRTSMNAILLWVAVWVLVACRPGASPPLTSIIVQLQWTHQARFAGLYVADQNGYFAEQGLAVVLLEGGARVDRLASLLDGRAQVSMGTADEIILWRAQGQPVRAIATIYRRSPIVFFALQQTGITEPQDFAGQTIRVTDYLIPSLHAMTARVGLTPDQYTEVVLPSEVASFATGEVPVWGGFSNGFLVSVQQAGYEVNVIYPDDYGVHFYADTFFASDDFIAASPAVLLRFLRAALKGWEWTVEHPAEAAALIEHYNPSADLELETQRMVSSLPLVNTGEDFIGWMDPAVWAGMKQTLSRQGVLAQPLDVTQAYTLQFLQEIYEE